MDEFVWLPKRKIGDSETSESRREDAAGVRRRTVLGQRVLATSLDQNRRDATSNEGVVAVGEVEVKFRRLGSRMASPPLPEGPDFSGGSTADDSSSGSSVDAATRVGRELSGQPLADRGRERGQERDDEAALHERLVAGARVNDGRSRDALAVLLRPHAYRLALQLLGNHEDALDCAQESLLRFFSAIESYDSRQPLLPWVRRIVRNRAIDMLRRRRVRRASSIDSSGPEGEALEFADESVAEPTDTLQLEQRRRLVWRCLSQLGPAHREILVLRDYQDLSYREIATLLAIPTGTVMSRLHRARAELRNLVAAQRSKGTQRAM